MPSALPVPMWTSGPPESPQWIGPATCRSRASAPVNRAWRDFLVGLRRVVADAVAGELDRVADAASSAAVVEPFGNAGWPLTAGAHAADVLGVDLG